MLRRPLLAAAVTLALSGCDPESTEPSQDPTPIPAPTGDTLGPEGGTLTHPSGAVLEVPEGALAESVELTITPVPAADAPGGGIDSAATGYYEFGPPGTSFVLPVRITLPRTDEGEYDDDPLVLKWWDEENDAWAALRGHGFEEGVEPGSDETSVWSWTRHFTTIGGGAVALGPVTTLTSTHGHTVDVQAPTNCTLIPAAARTAADIDGVVIHNTVGIQDAAESACYQMDPRSYFGCRTTGPATDCQHPVYGNIGPCVATANPFPIPFPTADGYCGGGPTSGAHYAVGREGEIVQIRDPLEIAHHVARTEDCTATSRAHNEFLIGIELTNASGGANDEIYTGAQMASLVQLVRYLLDEYGLDAADVTGINAGTGTADTWSNHVDTGVVFHRHLEGCRTGGRHTDPEGPFPEGAFWAALAEAPPAGGSVLLPGGDAMGSHAPGDGGSVSFAVNAAAPAPTVVGSATFTAGTADPGSLLVAAGTSTPLAAGAHAFNDVWVEGELVLAGNVDLTAFGTFWVGPAGIVRADPGAAVTVLADGLALIEGRFDAPGLHGWSALDPAGPGNDPTACDYPLDPAVEGPGGDAGSFALTVTQGPLFVPTVVTLGGDAHTWDYAGPPVTPPWMGGAGGDVTVTGGARGTWFHGAEPWPGAWIRAITYKDIHPYGCDLSGRTDGALQPLSSAVVRGFVTAGGRGPRSSLVGVNAEDRGPGGDGGAGGAVVITGAGKLWFQETSVFTGTGANELEFTPFMGSVSQQALLGYPIGATGGAGAAGANAGGGSGGAGGAGGDVTLSGSSNAAYGTAADDVLGWDEQGVGVEIGPSVSWGVIGTMSQHLDSRGDVQLTVSVVGGSGGGVGGSTGDDPGNFGAAGPAGTATVTITP